MQTLLSQAEAIRLLNMLKKAYEDSLTLPVSRKITTLQVQGDTKQDLFRINIYRGAINAQKFTFNGMIVKNDVTLLRLEINKNGRHRNPDGNIITGSHWHQYCEGFDTQFAFPATDIDGCDFVDTTLAFFEKFHVIDPPQLFDQMSIS